MGQTYDRPGQRPLVVDLNVQFPRSPNAWLGRWFFRRYPTGYMSGYSWRSIRHTVRTYPKRGIPVADIYFRVGRRAYRLWRGEYRDGRGNPKR